jgi:hypothetical protein
MDNAGTRCVVDSFPAVLNRQPASRHLILQRLRSAVRSFARTGDTFPETPKGSIVVLFFHTS